MHSATDRLLDWICLDCLSSLLCQETAWRSRSTHPRCRCGRYDHNWGHNQREENCLLCGLCTTGNMGLQPPWRVKSTRLPGWGFGQKTQSIFFRVPLSRVLQSLRVGSILVTSILHRCIWTISIFNFTIDSDRSAACNAIGELENFHAELQHREHARSFCLSTDIRCSR